MTGRTSCNCVRVLVSRENPNELALLGGLFLLEHRQDFVRLSWIHGEHGMVGFVHDHKAWHNSNNDP